MLSPFVYRIIVEREHKTIKFVNFIKHSNKRLTTSSFNLSVDISLGNVHTKGR